MKKDIKVSTATIIIVSSIIRTWLLTCEKIRISLGFELNLIAITLGIFFFIFAIIFLIIKI